MNAFRPWTIRDIELSDGVPTLEAPAQSAGVYAVLWWRGVPLGKLELAAARLPMEPAVVRQEIIIAIGPAVAAYVADTNAARLDGAESLPWSADTVHLLAALEAPLDRLLSNAADGSAGAPSVSVVICTRDRPQALARCLASLAQLEVAPAEVVVIDNAPSDRATRDVVAAHPGVGYAVEPRPGLDCARNAGIRHSKGEIIAYVDDDVCVHPTWLSRLRRGFERPSVMAVTGLVLPAELDTLAQYMFERNWGFGRGFAPRVFGPAHYRRTRARCTPVWDIGAGANMAFRRAAFEHVGGFDERLDAGAAGVAGDSEIWYRLLAAGFDCRYQPAAVVFHYHRRELEQLRRQVFNYMRGHVAALFVQYERTGDVGNLRRLVEALPRHYARATLGALLPKNRLRALTLGVELAGCAAGVGYYFRTRGESARSVPAFGRRVAEPSLTQGLRASARGVMPEASRSATPRSD